MGRHRIGDALTACGDTHPLSDLVLELESVLGVTIDHAVMVDLAGFEDIVDILGGYEICVDHATRDRKSGLALPAGCTLADGATTLAWLRSRHTEERRDAGWSRVAGTSDLDRNARQRAFLIEVLDRVLATSSPVRLLGLARRLAPHLTIDDALSLRDAVSWAWAMRGADITHTEIPVHDHTTAAGARVLVPAVDLRSLLDRLAGRG